MEDTIQIQDSAYFEEEYKIERAITVDGFWTGITTSEVFENFDAPIKQIIGTVSRFNTSLNLYFISNRIVPHIHSWAEIPYPFFEQSIMTVRNFNGAIAFFLTKYKLKELSRFRSTTTYPIQTSLHITINPVKWSSEDWDIAKKLGVVLGGGQIFARDVVDCGCEFDSRHEYPQAGEYFVVQLATDGILPPLTDMYIKSMDFSGPILKVNRDSCTYYANGCKGIVTKVDGEWNSGFGELKNQRWVSWLIATGKVVPPN